MKLPHYEELAELVADRPGPCLSLYQQTHRSHPDNVQDPIRFKNLVKTLETSLASKYPSREVSALLEPFRSLGDNAPFWNHTLDGLAVFAAEGFVRVYSLQRPVVEVAVVADSFHAKPLVRILQSADAFQVLALTRKGVRVFEGNRDVLDPIDTEGAVPSSMTEVVGEDKTEAHKGVVSAGAAGNVRFGSGSRKDEDDIDVERFFRAVDRAVADKVSKPSGLPLILAALGENQPVFRKVSHNSALLAQGIEADPESLSADDLRARAWTAIEPDYLARLAKLVEEFGAARSKGHGSADLATIADAAVAGRVATLLVEADRHDPGRIDQTTGRVSFEPIDDPAVDDLLDDLAETVLRKGGRVVVAPAERMPTDTGAAAIYRF